MLRTYTFAEIQELLDPEIRDKASLTIANWLRRGDGCAVYENAAFDSGSFGHLQFVSFGSSAAQLETAEPPQRLPDIGSKINWPYQLIGTCHQVQDARPDPADDKRQNPDPAPSRFNEETPQ